MYLNAEAVAISYANVFFYLINLPSGNFSPKKLVDLQNWQADMKFHGYVDEY
jgi:hypothetical protein